ncbi:MAG: recombinase family protein [Kovacikia sp.]
MSAKNFQEREVWEQLEKGRKEKAAQGGYAGYGSPAFGQRSLDGELIEDPTEQQIIDLIRRHHKSGKSLQQVADWLNRQGYTTKRGQRWQRISVKRVLDRLYGRTSRISGLDPQFQTDLTETTPEAWKT